MASIENVQDGTQRAGHREQATAEKSSKSPPDATHENYPTHRLRAIKAGARGVQFLVSSKEHLYDVEEMEGGDGVWQAVGVWEDATIQESIRTLRQRQQDGELPPKTTIAGEKAGIFGAGRKLGDFSNTAKHGGSDQ
ncbi:hypothetical protein G7054_g6512 [Neopestalotiopsis clavispora]|nr:hypothetical protein G7054_g6512 [Neopestalotiopsis clavispora]